MAFVGKFDQLLFVQERLSQISLDVAKASSAETDAIANQKEVQRLKGCEERELREAYRAEYEDNIEEYDGKYSDYTELPDFENELQSISAIFDDQLEVYAYWENVNHTEVITSTAEQQRLKLDEERLQQELSSDIQNDMNYGSGS